MLLNRLFLIFSLFSLSELSFSNTEFEIRYCPPNGGCFDVATLFGRNPNKDQYEEEFVFLNSENKGAKVFAGNLKGFSLIYGGDGSSDIYASIKGDIKKIDFSKNRYILSPASISPEKLNSLIKKNKSLPNERELKSDSEKKWTMDDKLTHTPNQTLVWKTTTIPNCGEVNYVVRTNQLGEKDTPGVEFDEHGKFYIPYDIQGIICTREGRIILQLAYWSGAAYSQSVAIIDTEIKAVTH